MPSSSISNYFLVVTVLAAASVLPLSSSQAVSVTQHSHPGRIISAAEGIDQRLRRQRRHKKDDLTYSKNEVLEESSSAQSTEQLLPQHVTNSLIEDLMLSPRIIGGTASAPNRYPYLVSLTYFGSHICGGSVRLAQLTRLEVLLPLSPCYSHRNCSSSLSPFALCHNII